MPNESEKETVSAESEAENIGAESAAEVIVASEKAYASEEKLNKTRKTTLRIVWGIVAAILLGIVIWLVVDAGIKPEVALQNEKVVIKDTYPAEIALEGAVVDYVDTPAVYETTNAASVGKRRKGRFVVTETSREVYMSVMNIEQKSVRITRGKDVYYINLGDEAATEKLFGEIKAAAQ